MTLRTRIAVTLLGLAVLLVAALAAVPSVIMLGAAIMGAPILFEHTPGKRRPNRISGGESDTWASTHPWSSTAHGPAVTRLRADVAAGRLLPWEYDDELSRILANPAVSIEPRPRHYSETPESYLRAVIQAAAPVTRAELARMTEAYNAPSSAYKTQHAKGLPTGDDRPVGYTVWKKGEGWVRNVAETETIETMCGKSQQIVTGVREERRYYNPSRARIRVARQLAAGHITANEARALMGHVR